MLSLPPHFPSPEASIRASFVFIQKTKDSVPRGHAHWIFEGLKSQEWSSWNTKHGQPVHRNRGPESRLEGGCARVCLQRKAGSLLLCSLLSLSATQGLGPDSNSFQKWFVHGCPIRTGQDGSEGQGELGQ